MNNQLASLSQIISNVIYEENQKALDSGNEVLCTATEYLADRIAEVLINYKNDLMEEN